MKVKKERVQEMIETLQKQGINLVHVEKYVPRGKWHILDTFVTHRVNCYFMQPTPKQATTLAIDDTNICSQCVCNLYYALNRKRGAL